MVVARVAGLARNFSTRRLQQNWNGRVDVLWSEIWPLTRKRLRKLNRLPIELFALLVQAIEIVKLARVLLHEVHDDIAVVEQDPPAEIAAFRARMCLTGGLQLDVQFARERFDVRTTDAGDHHEVIGDAKMVRDVENCDVLALNCVRQTGGVGG